MLKILNKNTLIAICDRCKNESDVIIFDGNKPLSYAFDSSDFAFSYNHLSEKKEDGYCNCPNCLKKLREFSKLISSLRKEFDKLYITDASWGGLCHYQAFAYGSENSPIQKTVLNLVSKEKSLTAISEKGWVKITHIL